MSAKIGLHNPFLTALVEDGIIAFSLHFFFYLTFSKVIINRYNNILLSIYCLFFGMTLSIGLKLMVQIFLLMIIIGTINNVSKKAFN